MAVTIESMTMALEAQKLMFDGVLAVEAEKVKALEGKLQAVDEMVKQMKEKATKDQDEDKQKKKFRLVDEKALNGVEKYGGIIRNTMIGNLKWEFSWGERITCQTFWNGFQNKKMNLRVWKDL